MNTGRLTNPIKSNLSNMNWYATLRAGSHQQKNNNSPVKIAKKVGNF